VSRRRFLVPPEALRAEVVELHPEEAAHARRVLRLGVGEEVWLLDGAGTLARAELVEVGRQAVRARGLQRLPFSACGPSRPVPGWCSAWGCSRARPWTWP